MKNRDVIVLLGPTSVGKTALAIKIARVLDTEIISADSMQIYRGMDIGTAKPSKEELSMVRHHMIDIIEPSEGYSVGRFLDQAVKTIEALHKRGRIPLVVGGTGLYIKALTRGLFSAPEADEDLRRELKMKEKQCPGYLYKMLCELDPEKAASINPNDLRRIIRALEVYFKTARPISELQKELTEPLPYSFTKIGLTRDRKELYRMIEKRVDEMFERGLVQEVQRLLEKHPSETPLQAIGYKEVILYLEGKKSLDEVISMVKRATKRYAKRQFTWFKKEEAVQWVDITGMFSVEEIYEKVLKETDLKRFIEA
ncbi:MAG: tRNA (adenosine(37)-N6)-dimethylallyltransferase MiaA [Nitrospirae bacterium]|nr:tRNA (adenosine(37)-N6)-dimethylallyltransferase MiaA [Nitrospirota bacterium]